MDSADDLPHHPLHEFAKRRDDVLRMEKTGEAPRKNTADYNLTFINQAITITASVTLVCYIMYTVSPEVIENFHTEYLYLTSVFVLVGLLNTSRLQWLTRKVATLPEIILRDRITQFIVLAWLLSFLFLIYMNRGEDLSLLRGYLYKREQLKHRRRNEEEIILFRFRRNTDNSDTLLEFIKYAKGKGRFLMVFLMYSPLLVLMKLHLYPNWKAKQQIFAHLFAGIAHRKI